MGLDEEAVGVEEGRRNGGDLGGGPEEEAAGVEEEKKKDWLEYAEDDHI